MAGVSQVGYGFLQGGMLSSFCTFIVWVLKNPNIYRALHFSFMEGQGKGSSSSARVWDALGRGLRKRSLSIPEALIPQEEQ